MNRRCCIFPLLVGLSATAAFGIHGAPGASTAASGQRRRYRWWQPNPYSRVPSGKRNNRSFQVATTDLILGGDTTTSTIESPSLRSESHTTNEQEAFIREALLENAMFSSLPETTLELLIQSFELTTVFGNNQTIVAQGDRCDHDYVYLVESGECTVLVDGKVVPEPYGTLKSMAIFGELGVLYNKTRTATIRTKSPSVTLYRINGKDFKSVLNFQAMEEDPAQLEKIDEAINQVAGTKTLYEGDIIRQYKSNRTWLWRRWQGTVFQHSFKTVALNMLLSLVFITITRWNTDPTLRFGLAPDKSHPFIARLEILRRLWSYQMSLTTFILTFFVNQAYSFWQDMYGVARRIQGRLNDFHLLLATSSKRNPDGTYTRESEKLMNDVGAFSRLFHALLWASYARCFSVLLTPKGLERMAMRGLMTSKQLAVLKNLDVPSNQLHNACLEWMMIRVWQAVDDGTLRQDVSLSQTLLNQMCELRSTYYQIGGKLSCRMPLPYTHFVQILVDIFLILSPFALYADLGAYSFFCVGVLTLFYSGLLNLAKIFLDPLDNEDFTKNSIDMDLGVLIRESNGGSTGWKNAGARLPFSVSPNNRK